MQVLRNEITTGLLVLITIGSLIGLVLYIGAPGVFKKLNTYYVQIDNAAGVKSGAAVNLAGRKVGQIISLQSPVPLKDRPEEFPNYEVLVTIRVEADALVYKKSEVRMVAYGLLSELVIDFTNGDENSGLAQEGHIFIGEREAALSELAPQIIEKLDPLILGLRETLADLRTVASNISNITTEGSEFNLAITRFRTLGDNLVSITSPEGEFTTSLYASMASLKKSMANVEKITNEFNGDDLKVTLANFRSASNDLKNVVQQADSAVSTIKFTLEGLSPELVSAGQNTRQFTDTIKRQPWRVIWPSTKKYPDEGVAADVEIRRALPNNRR